MKLQDPLVSLWQPRSGRPFFTEGKGAPQRCKTKKVQAFDLPGLYGFQLLLCIVSFFLNLALQKKLFGAEDAC